MAGARIIPLSTAIYARPFSPLGFAMVLLRTFPSIAHYHRFACHGHYALRAFRSFAAGWLFVARLKWENVNLQQYNSSINRQWHNIYDDT